MSVLAGKVAVITGGTSGIGARTAQLFVAEGARVVVAGRRREEGERLVGELGASAVFVETDVANEAQIKTLMAQAVERFGRIDCLLNSPASSARAADSRIRSRTVPPTA